MKHIVFVHFCVLEEDNGYFQEAHKLNFAPLAANMQVMG